MLPSPLLSWPHTPPDWELCVLCQGETAEPLKCPAVSKRQDPGAGYISLDNNLIKCSERGELAQHVDLRRLDEDEGIIAASKRTRSKVPSVDSAHDMWFFCHLDLGSEYHQAATLELDQHF